MSNGSILFPTSIAADEPGAQLSGIEGECRDRRLFLNGGHNGFEILEWPGKHALVHLGTRVIAAMNGGEPRYQTECEGN